MVEVPGSSPGGDTGKIVSVMALHVTHNVPISPHSLMGKPLSYTQVILVQFQVGVPLSLTITMPSWYKIHASLDKSGQVTTLIKWKSLVQIQDGALDRNNLFLYCRKCK